MWSGLGYNKRALNLHRTSMILTKQHGGKTPQSIEALEALPGFGPYTARAVLIFAFNKALVTVDTNIRRVLIHELHIHSATSMKEIWRIALEVLPKTKSRDWHNALMDYAALKLPTTPHIKPLTQQSKFKGSLREIRGGIIRTLAKHKKTTITTIALSLRRKQTDVRKAAVALERDNMIVIERNSLRLA